MDSLSMGGVSFPPPASGVFVCWAHAEGYAALFHPIKSRDPQLLRIPLQYGANEAGVLDDPSAPRFIRITDLRSDGSLREDTFKSLPEDVARPFILTEGDILLARSGATVGKAVRYRSTWGRACFAGYLIRFRPNEGIVKPSFIEYYTQSVPYREEVGLSSVQATIQNVSAQRYGEFRVPVPPLEEQERIIAMLDEVDRQGRGLTASVQLQISKLHEYRQALISAAVTGQLDVRSRAARALDPTAPEPLEEILT